MPAGRPLFLNGVASAELSAPPAVAAAAPVVRVALPGVPVLPADGRPRFFAAGFVTRLAALGGIVLVREERREDGGRKMERVVK